MGALTIALDITIVGALALPWVVLVVHLFFFEGENRVGAVVDWFRDRQLTAVGAVLLFAAAYTAGSAVARIAQDFFNDDDLFLQAGPRVWRMAMTEDRIIASVMCDADDNHLLPAPAGNAMLDDKVSAFQCLKTGCCNGKQLSAISSQPSAKPSTAGPGDASEKKSGSTGEAKCCVEDNEPPEKTEGTMAEIGAPHPLKAHCLCSRLLDWKARYTRDKAYGAREDSLLDAARDIFGLEENAILMKGEDPTLRLRQLHDQIMVLRGAAFNGLVAFLFCVFAWGVKVRRESPRGWARWALAVTPVLPMALAVMAATHHFSERLPTDPPYMEFSLFVVGAAGGALLWLPRRPSPEAAKHPAGTAWKWPGLSLLSFVLALSAMGGWWATEVLYAQQIAYSYDSQLAH